MKNRFLLIIMFFLAFASANAFWEKITTMPALYQNSYWLDVYFLEANPQYGWVCGYEGKVIRTTNGGATWQGTQIASANQLESIHFVSQTHGFCSGEGLIFRTTDGGTNWRDVTPATSDALLWGTYFLDENNGYVIGGNCTGAQYFYRTSDAGDSWDTFYTFYPGTKLADCMVNKNTGIGYAASSGLIWKTTNFGTTWLVHSRTGGLDWHEEITNYGRSFLVPYSLSCDGTQTNIGGVRFSVNDGANWRSYTTAGSMYGTFLIDSLRGWACGINRTVYYTSDGGFTWDLRNCGLDQDANLDDIWFINDTTGWLAGNGLYKLRKSSIPSPKISALGEIEVCKGDSVVLSLEGTYNDIIWSTGAKTYSIKVGQSGKYSVFVTNSECEYAYSNEIEVKVRDAIVITAESSNSSPCVGDTVEIKITSPYASIRWQSGESQPIIYAYESGLYRVHVVDYFGCEDSLDINVKFNELPTPKINALTRIDVCKGDSVDLRVVPNFPQIDWYNGDNRINISGPALRTGASGVYYVKVVDANGCRGISDSVKVNIREETNRLALQLEVGKTEFFVDSTNYPDISCRQLFIRNIAKDNAVISNPYLFYKLSFSIPQSQLPLTIEPNELKSLVVCYSPRNLLFERDTLIIEDICNDHYLPIVAFGEGNKYLGGTRCDVGLLLETKKINSGTHFITISPYPNPSSKQAMVPIAMVKSEQSSENPQAELFDVFGNIVAYGVVSIESVESKPEGIVESGSVIFDVSQLPRGIYIVRISNIEKNDIYRLSVE